MTALTVLVVARGAHHPAALAAFGAGVTVRGATRHTLAAACRAVDSPWALVVHDTVTALPDLCRAHMAAHDAGARLVAGTVASTAATRGPGLPDTTLGAVQGGSVSAPSAVLAAVVGGASADPESLDLLLRLEARLGPMTVLPEPVLTRMPGDDLAVAAARGRARARDARRHPGRAAALRDGFRESSPRETVLRRALLAARVPPRWLARAGAGPSLAFWGALRRDTARRDWGRATGGTPVLMYHAFAEPGEATGRYVVGARRLAAQMVALRLMGMRPVALADLMATLARGEEPPRRRFAVTIDDGYRDTLTVAAPVLRRLRVPATLFVVTDHLGGANRWDPDGVLVGRPLIAAGEVARLAALGVTVGAHTRRHPRLADLTDTDAQVEIEESVRTLTGNGPAIAFAYPHGSFNDATPVLVAAAGCAGAVTTGPGLVTGGADVFRLPRVEMRGTDPWWRFLMKVRTGHDRWV